MNLAALRHQTTPIHVEIQDQHHVTLRLETGQDIAEVVVVFGDPYEMWAPDWSNERQQMAPTYTTAHHQHWQTKITVPTKRLSYAFVVTGVDGQQAFVGDTGIFLLEQVSLTNGNLYFRLPYLHENEVIQTPAWVKETVWYQIFPERFANGDARNDPEQIRPWDSQLAPTSTDFFGGDLQGIIDHLDYLTDLGVNGLYLTPIFTSPSNHKYDTIDYRKIDAHFGDETTFKALVDAAHQRGMRVMLDAVFNHIGAQSPLWQDVLANGEQSAYADWFHVNEWPIVGGQRPNFDTFAFTDQMPKWRTDNPEVKAYLLDVARYWLAEFDIDGWRLDVANEVDHAFWQDFRRVVKTVKPDAYILGEIWHDATPWLNGDQFDGVMNYAGMAPIMDYFVAQKGTLTAFVQAMNAQFVRYPDAVLPMLFNLVDSHDAPRLLTLVKGDIARAKQILALLFLQRGTPNIYYGTEVGLAGAGDPDNRRVMPWDVAQQNQELSAFVKSLIALRRAYAIQIADQPLTWQTVDDARGVLSFRVGKKLQATFNVGNDVLTLAETPYLSSGWQAGQLQPNGFVIEEI